mgnify:CR=1 FL=1
MYALITCGNTETKQKLEQDVGKSLSAVPKLAEDHKVSTAPPSPVPCPRRWLGKQGGRVKTWKKRYVILSGNVLYYFKSPKDKAPAGFLPLENIEVRFAGQMGRLGRYPVHFHMIGAVRDSYVRSVSIHHTYNRAVAIHGVHYLRVQDNVAFETKGHTYFIEDGVETKNIITGNLASNTRESFVGPNSDATPSSFWLVHGDNYDANPAADGAMAEAVGAVARMVVRQPGVRPAGGDRRSSPS